MTVRIAKEPESITAQPSWYVGTLSPVKLSQLLNHVQERERYPHCEQGTMPRPARDAAGLAASGRTLESWYNDPQPDEHFEFWLHICEVANAATDPSERREFHRPGRARRLFQDTILRFLPLESSYRPMATQYLQFMHRWARGGASSEEQRELLKTYDPGSTVKCREYRELAWRMCRWFLGADESLSPVYCAPLLSQVLYRERLRFEDDAHKPRDLRQVQRELWEWWKTQVTVKEWAGGHF